jgi:solute carrier family 36 (proton-coupled amino acid transporter)
MKYPERFPKVLTISTLIVASVMLIVGVLSYAAFGSKVETVLLLNLPRDKGTSTVQSLYAIAIALTFPMMSFPAMRIFETYIVPLSGRGDWKQKWKKNILRSLVVVMIALLSYYASDNLDLFVSLTGSVTCIPLSFIFPSLFHYKIVAESTKAKIGDVLLGVFGLVSMVLVTYVNIYSWITKGSEVPGDRCG